MKLNWYAPKETAADPEQMALYAVRSAVRHSDADAYWRDLEVKVRSELEIEQKHKERNTVDIYEELSSSFEIETWYGEDQIANSIVHRMSTRLYEDPLCLIEVKNEVALRSIREIEEFPQAALYQAVSDL